MIIIVRQGTSYTRMSKGLVGRDSVCHVFGKILPTLATIRIPQTAQEMPQKRYNLRERLLRQTYHWYKPCLDAAQAAG
jgi:hypothetical protein